MREIKFRLIKNKKIVGFELHKTSLLFEDNHIEIYHSTDQMEWCNIGSTPWYFINHDEKDQFTGLHDKNGKEIWEGDIVKTPYNDIYDFAYYKLIFNEEKGAFYLECVALHHKEKGFKDISKGGYCNGYLCMEGEKLVIGNIYEHGYLLEDKDAKGD